eukprot:8146902-Alexandrium_andersonii.AAC.1
MSASLVGSEMCIRDSTTRPAPLMASKAGHSHHKCSGMQLGAAQCGQQSFSATEACIFLAEVQIAPA